MYSKRSFPVWSHLGLNQGPPDYESGATNQLSYGTQKTIIFYMCKTSAKVILFFIIQNMYEFYFTP